MTRRANFRSGEAHPRKNILNGVNPERTQLSISRQDLRRIVTLGARWLLDGAVEQSEWSSKLVQYSGESLQRVANLAGTSTDSVLAVARPHAEKVAALMRDGKRLAALSWIDNYVKRVSDEIERHGGVVHDDEDVPDEWEGLCKHPATQQPGENLALVICGLVSIGFLYLLFTNPRLLIHSLFGVLIGVVGLLTLGIAGLLLYTSVRSRLRKRARRVGTRT